MRAVGQEGASHEVAGYIANELSEPTKPEPHAGADEWLRRRESELAVSPIVLGELQFGILLLPRGRKRSRLLEWFAKGAEGLLAFDFRHAEVKAVHPFEPGRPHRPANCRPHKR